MRNGDVIEIIYQAKNGKITQRNIRVIEAKETYVKAYCYTRRQVRIFQLGNILARRIVRSA
jgi:predicted DNA-binding transcriptional regulator YafY